MKTTNQDLQNIAKQRSLLYKSIREFFDKRNYIEVETPTLSADLIPEATIDNFATTFINEFEGSKEMYMIPSPEIFMKKLIANGIGSIYQISKCFRNCEQIGQIHNPEFSMLEYYTVDYDEKSSIELTKTFLKETALSSCPKNVLEDFEVVSVRDAVLRYTPQHDVDLDKLQDARELRKKAEELGLLIPGPESWDDTFNRIFINFVEPNLPKDHPVCLTDYPYQIECLAQRQGNYRRRWELYINGIEVANCYLEERDVQTTKDYYEAEYQKLLANRAKNGKVIPDIDNSFANIFTTFPKCSGVAIGLDRLLMVETNALDIKDVLLFPFQM